MPGFITGLGVLLIAAGITLPLLGEERVDRMASWWFRQSDMMVGVWGTVVAILGAVVIWASFREGKGVLRDACEIHGDSTVCRDATVPRPLDVVLRGLLS
jgi:ABC-type xylose transport system permease subunit